MGVPIHTVNGKGIATAAKKQINSSNQVNPVMVGPKKSYETVSTEL